MNKQNKQRNELIDSANSMVVTTQKEGLCVVSFAAELHAEMEHSILALKS